MSIKLEISFGEALDKLSILDIKKNKIKDERVNKVKIEYDYLFENLNEQIEKNIYHYNLLKKINLDIWELQDIIRDSGKNSYKLTDEILNLNDARFLVKNKLNIICKSKFLEQKGYEKRILYLNISNITYEQFLHLNCAIRYFSIFYDSVLIFGKNYSGEIIYSDDPTIIFTNEEKKDNYDYININDFSKKITHSYFKNNKNEECKNEEFGKNIRDFYFNLNLNIEKCKLYFYNNDKTFSEKVFFL